MLEAVLHLHVVFTPLPATALELHAPPSLGNVTRIRGYSVCKHAATRFQPRQETKKRVV